MRKIYLRMALNSISKNRVIYIPYILSNSLMGMIIYFVMALANDPVISSLNGGVPFERIMSLGSVIFAGLAVIFVFYLSFFISRNRRKEYGVLSVLGMEKKHILYMIFIENSILAAADIICSCIGGIVFYKMIQLLLVKFLDGPTDYGLFVSPDAMLVVAAVFVAVSLMVFMVQAFKIWKSDAYSDMTTSYDREGIRKSDVVIAIIGAVCLIVSYVLFLRMPQVFSELTIINYGVRFVISCVLLMAATFMLFSSGSVIALSLLKKNKKLYYNKLNFINVSSLIHRMRRNGVGLAFVSILSTLVVVTVTAIIVFVGSLGEYLEALSPVSYIVSGEVTEEFEEGMISNGLYDYTIYSVDIAIDFPCYVIENELIEKSAEDAYYDMSNGYMNIYDMTVLIDIDSAEKLLHKDLALDDHQFGLISVDSNGKNIDPMFDCIVDQRGNRYDYQQIEDAEGLANYIGAGIVLIYPGNADETIDYYISTISNPENDYVVDYRHSAPGTVLTKEEYKELIKSSSVYMFSTSASMEDQQAFYVNFMSEADAEGSVITVYNEAVDFLMAFKALLVMCFMFLAIFLIMTIMLLYYRNLFDGYEDVRNYGIMRNIGLDDELINKVVFIQVLITLVIPILVAMVNALVGERCILGIIRLFESSAGGEYIFSVLISSLIAIVTYMIAGIIASRTYAKIVKGDKNTFNLS